MKTRDLRSVTPILSFIGLLLLGAAEGSFPKSTWLVGSSRGNQVALVPNGRFSAEHGLFFAESDERIHLYSHLPMIPDEKGERVMTPVGDELSQRWKGEPYYHEVYNLRNGQWVRSLREFSGAPNMYLDFGPCDPLNQLDLYSRYDPPKALKDRAMVKVKDTIEVGGGRHFATIIFSDAPDQKVKYPLKIALAVPDQGQWKVTDTVEVSEFGYFCGSRMLETKLANGQRASVLLVYVDEPAASSNYIAVYSFLISSRESKPKPVVAWSLLQCITLIQHAQ